MNKSRQPKPRQLEVLWPAPESFALMVEQTVDGERVVKKAAQVAADKLESAQLQTQLL
jgi:hypothetical protein